MSTPHPIRGGPLHDVLAALVLLTRLPVARFLPRGPLPPLGRAAWAFPLAGLLAGAVAGGAYAVACALRLPPPLAAIWALTAAVVFTGALHEDGLADAADGFGGGATPERRLLIMRDSRIGSFGAVALILSFALRWAALAALATPSAVWPALLAIGALGRGAMLLPLALLPPARPDGMAAALGPVRPAVVALGLGLAAVAVLLLLPSAAALRSLFAAALVTLGATHLARTRLGGHTGDVLGAVVVLVECVVLSVLATGR